MTRMHLPTIHLVSLNQEWCEFLRRAFQGSMRVRVTHGDIRHIPRKNTAFVSPANSLGSMDGGIDAVLTELLPGCDTELRNKIAELDTKTTLGRPILPVGSGILIPHKETGCALISAPTMFRPQSVSHTRNAYWSTRAALEVLFKWRSQFPILEKPYTTVVLTSHCCGIGNMSARNCAIQMYEAIKDFEQPRGSFELQYTPRPDLVLGPEFGIKPRTWFEMTDSGEVACIGSDT